MQQRARADRFTIYTPKGETQLQGQSIFKVKKIQQYCAQHQVQIKPSTSNDKHLKVVG